MADLTVNINADLKYINWIQTPGTDDPKQWTADGLIEFDVDPTLLVVPRESCTITWKLSYDDGGGQKGKVAFAADDGIVWNANQPGSPVALSRDSDTQYSCTYDNSTGADEVEWHYTINVVLSKDGDEHNTYTPLAAQCDPDVENEPPAG